MSKLNDLLKEAQFDENEVKSINEIIGKSTEWMPKAEWNKLNEEKKSLEARLSDTEKQFKDLEKKVGDDDSELKKQLEEMKKERDSAKKEALETITKFERKANCTKLFADRVYDVDDVCSKLDFAKITFNEKNEPVAGLEDQIKAMEESRPNYFKPDKASGSLETHKPKSGSGDDGNSGKSSEEETYVSQFLFPDKK